MCRGCMTVCSIFFSCFFLLDLLRRVLLQHGQRLLPSSGRRYTSHFEQYLKPNMYGLGYGARPAKVSLWQRFLHAISADRLGLCVIIQPALRGEGGLDFWQNSDYMLKRPLSLQG